MLEPVGNGQNVALLKKFSNLEFFSRGVGHPIVDVVGNFQRRQLLVPVVFVSFERYGAVPFLFTHRQNFFRRIGIERDILEKEQVGIAAKRSLLRKRWQ